MIIVAIILWAITKDLILSTFWIISILAIINFLKFKNNFLILLLRIELLGVVVLVYTAFKLTQFSLTPNLIFFLIVTIVAEATLSLRILISLARIKRNEIETTNLFI